MSHEQPAATGEHAQIVIWMHGRRHWKEVMRITGVELNTAEDVFKLQHLLEAHLGEHRDEIEELCACAIKEEQVRAGCNSARHAA